MEEKSRKNPWLGLESYREGEILYGRDDDIRDLTQCVLNDTDTLLYGKSGIGKSSILNAGVIPAARRYGYLPVLIRLSHKGLYSYLCQIKEAIANAILPIPTDENGNLLTLSPDEQTVREQELALRIREVVPCKDKEKETLYEYFHRHTFHNKDGERIKLLIIFDQFEEIFTLQKNNTTKKCFFVELANFLNDVMPDELQPDAIIQPDVQTEMTVFDADSVDDLFSDLILTSGDNIPEYVTDNTIHLVFTIREDFLSEFEYYSTAIPSLKQNRYGLRPINEEQASQIILRPVPDLISESVARLIIENVTGRNDFKLDGVPEIEVDSAVLSLYLNRLYDAKEGDEITAELVEQKGGEIISNFYNDAISEISESAVEYLEDRLLNGQGRRDNITVYDAVHDGNVTEQELDILCNKKKILRQFNYAGDLRIEYVHDILCPVVKVHKDERVLLKQQEAERERQEAEHEALVRRQKEELEKIEREARRQRKKIRMRLNISLLLLLAGIVTWAIWFFFNRMPFKESYADFTVRYGWPEGIGKKLSDSEKGQMPVYYQLVRYGYNKKNTRVNVLNNFKQPARNKFDESPLVGLYETDGTDEQAKEFAILQRQTAYWIYTPDNNNNVFRKTAYGMNGEELYSIQFFRSSSQSKNETSDVAAKWVWANYINREGQSLRIRDNGADRMRIVMNDSTGYYENYRFFNETGTPQPNDVGAYGYRYVLGKDGRILQKTPVDVFGDPIEETSITYEAFDEFGRWVQASAGKAEYSSRMVVFTMKERTDSLLFGEYGELKYRSETMRDDNYSFYYKKGMPVDVTHYRIGSEGRILTYQKQILPQTNPNVQETRFFYADSVMPYRIKHEETEGKRFFVAYYGGMSSSEIDTPIREGSYHKIVTDTLKEEGLTKVITDYLDVNDSLSLLCEYNRDVAYYNEKNEMVKHVTYKNDSVYYAYLNEYENGMIVAQSVMGVDGKTPVRYPKWEMEQLYYYKMKYIRNFSDDLVAIKGVNEFGEESPITVIREGKLLEYRLNVLPAQLLEKKERGNRKIVGTQIYFESLRQVDWTNQVEYIRISDMQGTWYRAGIRDGDLLISYPSATMIKVARPNLEKKTYDILDFSVSEGEEGVEHYPVYFNQKEMERYNNAIQK